MVCLHSHCTALAGRSVSSAHLRGVGGVVDEDVVGATAQQLLAVYLGAAVLTVPEVRGERLDVLGLGLQVSRGGGRAGKHFKGFVW